MLILVWFGWILYIQKKVIFWIWLWQLKEYRKDRMKAHFRLKSSKKLFLNKIYFLKIVVFLSFFGLFLLKFYNFILIFASASIYIFLLLAALIFGKKDVKKPVFTQKIKLLYVANIIFFLFAVPASLFFFPFQSPYLPYFLTIVLLDIFLPVFVSISLALLTPLTNFQKFQIVKQAKKKIENLQNDLLVIGITGSYGKTSTKEFLAEILSLKFKVCKTEANNNTEMGVAKTVLEKLNKTHEIFIVEMAAYKKEEIKKICNIVRPSIGILTGIGTQHFGLFGSQENIIKAKYELIDSLPEKGLAVFNGDSNFFLDIYKKTKKPKKFYSLNNPQANIHIGEIKEFFDRIEFKIFDREGETVFKTNLIGKQNISNILAAILVACELGIRPAEIKEIVKNFRPFPKTMELKSGVNGTIIIDDSYSGNFEGVVSAIEYLKNYSNNKKVVIFYPLIELGVLSRDIHKKIGKKIGEVCDLCILVNKDFAKEIKEGAIENGMEEQNIKIMEKSSEAVKRVKDFARKGDVVLLENRVPERIIKSLTC